MNRKQSVQIGSFKSTYLSVTSGVPRGSLLGPLLFLIYVLDMPDGLKSVPYMFADDPKRLNFRQHRSSSFLQSDLAVPEKWCIENICSSISISVTIYRLTVVLKTLSSN